MKGEPVLGKREVVAALIREGFPVDEAGRAYELIMETIGAGLRKGRTIYFRRICKIWSLVRPPRRYWDNWNQRYVYFGERRVLKIRPFLLKERNILADRWIKTAISNAEKSTAQPPFLPAPSPLEISILKTERTVVRAAYRMLARAGDMGYAEVPPDEVVDGYVRAIRAAGVSVVGLSWERAARFVSGRISAEELFKICSKNYRKSTGVVPAITV